MTSRERTEVLWCGTRKSTRKDGWAFPPAVRKKIIELCEGQTVLHLFGGKADFGTTMDIDPATRPDVVGDCWLPPFKTNAFDVVVMDPPYVDEFKNLNSQKIHQLFTNAADIARRRLIWFHTMWVDQGRHLPLERAWLVKVGHQCAVRCLQVFTVPDVKRPRVEYFTRGPAIRYNRWLIQPQGLPFPEETITI